MTNSLFYKTQLDKDSDVNYSYDDSEDYIHQQDQTGSSLIQPLLPHTRTIRPTPRKIHQIRVHNKSLPLQDYSNSDKIEYVLNF